MRLSMSTTPTRNAILKKVELFKDNIQKITNKFTRMHNSNRFGGIGYLVIKLTSMKPRASNKFLFNTLHTQDRCWKYVERFSLKNNSVFSAKPSPILLRLFNFSGLFFEHVTNLRFVNFTMTVFGLLLFLWSVGSL